MSLYIAHRSSTGGLYPKYLGIYPKELKSLSQRAIYTPMFTAALVTLAKMWKQLKCPSMDGWIEKKWSAHAKEYSAFERSSAIQDNTDATLGRYVK